MSWEYWPVYVFNIPIVFIWLWNALRARGLFFFTLTNPGIATGGFFGESKSGILQHIPDRYKPKTLLVKSPVNPDDMAMLFSENEFQFPIIVKPEVGERGWLITKIHSMEELKTYMQAHPIDVLWQTFIDLPLELSIMVYTYPDQRQRDVTSICEKKYLQIAGNGYSSIGQLILEQDRAVLQLEKLLRQFGHKWNEVLPAGEVLILETIGNHCRGTMFLDRQDEIDEPIREVMLSILESMPDIYYGRFDLKTASWASLRKGEHIQIMEFNGTSSDPAHIYQPGYPLIRAYRDMARHWGIMRRIARQNRNRGFQPAKFKELIPALMLYFRYKRTN
jgi:hypothetical protein